MEYLDALRDAQKELIASSEYRLLFRLLNKQDEREFVKVKQKLIELEDEIRNNPCLDSIVSNVSTLLEKVSLQSDSDNNEIHFNFSAIETSEILKKLGLNYGSDPIDISRNGLGRNNLLYIALLVSQFAAKDMHGEKTYFRLIAIEEPEAHLHPQLQDHLSENIESIQKENSEETQLLITSHSTHVASKLCLENTVAIFKDHGQVRSCNIIRNLNIEAKEDKETITFLSKYLDLTKSRIFFSRKIILVEGFSEQFLIPVFFKRFTEGKTSIEQAGFSIVNVNGVAFKHFLKVIKGGFFVKCLVLTDKDF